MVVLGRIVAPYGVKGWVKVHPFGDDPASWRGMPRWWLGPEAEGKDWRQVGLREIRPHGQAWVARLEGVDDRTAAEGLAGLFVGAPRDALPLTDEGEFYWADLVGLAVENARGECLGRVAELVETGANPVLVVRAGEARDAQERLLPFVAQVVKDVDLAGGRILVAWERDW